MKVGIQLFSVRNSMSHDPLGTIRKVAEAGYKNLEAANGQLETDPGLGFGVSAKEIKTITDGFGAQFISAHLSPMVAASDSLKAAIEYYNILGTSYFAIPMAFYKDRDEVLTHCENWNKVAEETKKAGIQLVYHNHYHEFQHFGDETIFDMLMKNLDSQMVQFELDTFWVMRGGADPIALLKKLGARAVMIHQKDYAFGYEDTINVMESVEREKAYVNWERFVRDLNSAVFTEIGTGIMDIQKILDTANTVCKTEYVVLEQDYSSMGEIESIQKSMSEFKKFDGIEW